MKLKDAIRTMKFKKVENLNHQLYTTWGEQLDTEHVLEEYPRPQLRRDNYAILNGYWDYCITKDEKIPREYEGKILVPFSPESILSGVNKQLMPGEFLWYRRSLNINKKQEDKRCILHFGAVDQFCEVYVNHQKVAEHMGGYLPFSTDITNVLMEGENILLFKVKDESDTSYHSRGKQKLDRGGMFYTAQSGIWQTVWMEWVPSIYIESLRITPMVNENAVEVIININTPIISNKELDYIENLNLSNEKENIIENENIIEKEIYKETENNKEKESYNDSEYNISKEYQQNITYHIDIYGKGTFQESVESKNSRIIIPMKEFEYWSPENPYLYDMIITVGEDRVQSYFAMRLIEVKNDNEGIVRIYLNNRPYFQNGVLDQGYWPDGLYTAPSDEALIFDIQKVKELGFNMIRKHIKIEPLRWYYHCDRLGVIVWQDIVNGGGKYNTLLVGYLPSIFPNFKYRLKDKHYRLFGRENADGRKEWLEECEATIKHLYNCPSIAVWVPFNEAWGQFDSKKVYNIIKEYDNTRLIDHASGWYDQKCGDFNSIHNYFHPLVIKNESRPVVLSEFGGYACYINEHSFSWQIYGYRIYINDEALNDAFQNVFKEITKLEKKGLSAAVYTQVSDVEDEVNGLFTYDRKVCKVEPIQHTF